jgi:preprotein translocase subunit YajC
MINLNNANPEFCFVLGVVLLIAMFYFVMREEQAKKIRESRYWPIAFIGWPLALSIPAKLMLPFFDQAQINEDIFVPSLFGSVLLLCGVSLFIQHRRMKKEAERDFQNALRRGRRG